MKITLAIASTTHIDRHNERMAKAALDDMAEQIKAKYRPHLKDHDFNRQDGVVLSGKVAKLEGCEEYGLFVVVGLFEDGADRSKYRNGDINTEWGKYEEYLDQAIAEYLQTYQPPLPTSRRSAERNIADLLETHLNSTSILPDGSVYKIKRYIASTGDLEIHVYPKDHDEYDAHFHVISKQKGIDARFKLDTLELNSNKRGKISPSDVKKIQKFFEWRPDMLAKLRSEHKRLN